MAFALIIIGDEILSGHRQDKHFSHIQALFKQRGLSVSQVQYLSDDRQRITHAIQQALNSGDIVLSCGGIGATPDDHTRQAVASAMGVDLHLHPEAERLITQFCIARGDIDMTTQQNQSRLNMGRFPVGAHIIPIALTPSQGLVSQVQRVVSCIVYPVFQAWHGLWPNGFWIRIMRICFIKIPNLAKRCACLIYPNLSWWL